jgi:hypothetical protein
VRTLARVQKVVSDLSGTEVDESEAVQIIVRRGPGIDRPLVIDALPGEVGDLSDAPDIYSVELKPYNGEASRELLVTIKDLKKLVADGNIEALFENARGTRGRPPLLRRS